MDVGSERHRCANQHFDRICPVGDAKFLHIWSISEQKEHSRFVSFLLLTDLISGSSAISSVGRILASR